MTASSANAEAVSHCQHVLIIAAKLPAAAPEGQIFLIFLSLGMGGEKEFTKWMWIGS